jgi:predicted nucleic acid-binding protein
MSRTVLVDTGPLYALAMRQDALHTRARKEFDELTGQGWVLTLSFSNILETQRLLLRRESMVFVHEFVQAVQKGFALINPLAEDYLAAQEILKRYNDQKITLFDGVLFVLSQRLSSGIWTFDRDFDVLSAQVWRHQNNRY